MVATSTSNPTCVVNIREDAYPYPSHVIAPNFATVKLSGKNKYNVWRTQVLCLLKSHHMLAFINGQFPNPAWTGKGKVEDIEAWIASDSLVNGWILGSLSEEAVTKVVNRLTSRQRNTDFTSKDVWDELQRSYGPSPLELAAGFVKLDNQNEMFDQVEEEFTATRAGSMIEVNSISEDAKSKDGSQEEKNTVENTQEKQNKDGLMKQKIYKSILQGETEHVISLLEIQFRTPLNKITNNGNTILHVAVASSIKNHALLVKLLAMVPTAENTLLDLKNSDGSTLLHVAAIVGNTKAVDILVERNPDFLLSKDNEGQTPLAISLSNMHSETSRCLLGHIKEKGYDVLFSGKIGEELLVLAISSKDFNLANMMIDEDEAAHSEAVLMSIAQNFPREPNFWERRGFGQELTRRARRYTSRNERLLEFCNRGSLVKLIWTLFLFGFYVMQVASENFLKVIVRPFIEDTFQIHEDAVSLLRKRCIRLFRGIESNAYHHCYTNPIFEATRQNASTFVRCIMFSFPDAIWSTNEDGHSFIQYSVINRSEKIYNLLYEMSEHKNIYRTIKDSSGNNLLHLAARLAPASKLNLISGAALQIQRDLQWFKEVEGFVCPLNHMQKNFDDETPGMVFTREHKDLVIAGEKWIKATAESYTITAALITTIVFAAAITVPGGNNQESGIPVFTNNIAFKIFAISDALSLFTAVTSLLMFLSILTARFAEQDFLFKLPKRLIIGLTMLFVSTTAMIIAFAATLYLVFGERNLWMLIPIGALTCLPITSFVTLQFPLIVDLMTATYGQSIFVKEMYDSYYFY